MFEITNISGKNRPVGQCTSWVHLSSYNGRYSTSIIATIIDGNINLIHYPTSQSLGLIKPSEGSTFINFIIHAGKRGEYDMYAVEVGSKNLTIIRYNLILISNTHVDSCILCYYSLSIPDGSSVNNSSTNPSFLSPSPSSQMSDATSSVALFLESFDLTSPVSLSICPTQPLIALASSSFLVVFNTNLGLDVNSAPTYNLASPQLVFVKTNIHQSHDNPDANSNLCVMYWWRNVLFHLNSYQLSCFTLANTNTGFHIEGAVLFSCMWEESERTPSPHPLVSFVVSSNQSSEPHSDCSDIKSALTSVSVHVLTSNGMLMLLRPSPSPSWNRHMTILSAMSLAIHSYIDTRQTVCKGMHLVGYDPNLSMNQSVSDNNTPHIKSAPTQIGRMKMFQKHKSLRLDSRSLSSNSDDNISKFLGVWVWGLSSRIRLFSLSPLSHVMSVSTSLNQRRHSRCSSLTNSLTLTHPRPLSANRSETPQSTDVLTNFSTPTHTHTHSVQSSFPEEDKHTVHSNYATLSRTSSSSSFGGYTSDNGNFTSVISSPFPCTGALAYVSDTGSIYTWCVKSTELLCGSKSSPDNSNNSLEKTDVDKTNSCIICAHTFTDSSAMSESSVSENTPSKPKHIAKQIVPRTLWITEADSYTVQSFMMDDGCVSFTNPPSSTLTSPLLYSDETYEMDLDNLNTSSLHDDSLPPSKHHTLTESSLSSSFLTQTNDQSLPPNIDLGLEDEDEDIFDSVVCLHSSSIPLDDDDSSTSSTGGLHINVTTFIQNANTNKNTNILNDDDISDFDDDIDHIIISNTPEPNLLRLPSANLSYVPDQSVPNKSTENISTLRRVQGTGMFPLHLAENSRILSHNSSALTKVTANVHIGNFDEEDEMNMNEDFDVDDLEDDTPVPLTIPSTTNVNVDNNTLFPASISIHDSGTPFMSSSVPFPSPFSCYDLSSDVILDLDDKDLYLNSYSQIDDEETDLSIVEDDELELELGDGIVVYGDDVDLDADFDGTLIRVFANQDVQESEPFSVCSPSNVTPSNTKHNSDSPISTDGDVEHESDLSNMCNDNDSPLQGEDEDLNTQFNSTEGDLEDDYYEHYGDEQEEYLEHDQLDDSEVLFKTINMMSHSLDILKNTPDLDSSVQTQLKELALALLDNCSDASSDSSVLSNVSSTDSKSSDIPDTLQFTGNVDMSVLMAALSRTLVDVVNTHGQPS